MKRFAGEFTSRIYADPRANPRKSPDPGMDFCPIGDWDPRLPVVAGDSRIPIPSLWAECAFDMFVLSRRKLGIRLLPPGFRPPVIPLLDFVGKCRLIDLIIDYAA